MKKIEQTRREFLRTAGKGMIGAAALTAIPASFQTAHAEAEIAAPAWPWTWHQMDVEEVKANVYENFSQFGGCGAAVASGILEILADKYGYPYNQIPNRLMAVAGGGYGNKNLCGSLGGAFLILGLFVESPGAIRTELYNWYKDAQFPMYQHPGTEEHKFHTAAGSELCRDSVGNWMKASSAEFGSPERIHRCASLSADVAGKLVELLNAAYAPAAATAEEEPKLADNEYIGVGKGFGGDIKVKVTMDGNKIKKIDVLEHSETAGICDKAFAQIPDAVIANQSVEVDAVAGATRSSEGLIAAIKDALSKVD